MICKQCEKEALMLFPNGLCVTCNKSTVVVRPKIKSGTHQRYEYMRERNENLKKSGIKPKSNAEAMRRYRDKIKKQEPVSIENIERKLNRIRAI